MSHTLFDTPQPVDERRRNGAGTAALVLGLLSVVLSVLTGVPAVVAGLVGLARARRRRAGWVTSSVGLVLGLASVGVVVAAVHYLVPVYHTAQTLRGYQEQGLPSTSTPQGQRAVAQGRAALGQLGVEPSSVSCRTPEPSVSRVSVHCAGTTTAGAPAVIEGSCPTTDLLRGEATCDADVNGQPHRVRVRLQDGVPDVQVL